jgi:sacsin
VLEHPLRRKNSALIEWNQLLFDTYIPQAWATLLEVLVQVDQVKDIFNAWPVLQANVQSGDYFYWKDMPFSVIKYALDRPIWPFYGTPALGQIDSVLVSSTSILDDVLDVLVRTGLHITQPPEHVTDILVREFSDKIRVLSPETAYEELLVRDLESLSTPQSDPSILDFDTQDY